MPESIVVTLCMLVCAGVFYLAFWILLRGLSYLLPGNHSKHDNHI